MSLARDPASRGQIAIILCGQRGEEIVQIRRRHFTKPLSEINAILTILDVKVLDIIA